jgi:hypothetical protein
VCGGAKNEKKQWKKNKQTNIAKWKNENAKYEIKCKKQKQKLA